MDILYVCVLTNFFIKRIEYSTFVLTVFYLYTVNLLSIPNTFSAIILIRICGRFSLNLHKKRENI